jgi:hypothetical protein
MDSANECFSGCARQHKAANMNVRAIPGAYLFRLYLCDKEMSWPHHIGETHQPDWVVYVRDRNLWEITFRLTNVIPERIIFVSRCITVYRPHAVTIISKVRVTTEWAVSLTVALNLPLSILQMQYLMMAVEAETCCKYWVAINGLFIIPTQWYVKRYR